MAVKRASRAGLSPSMHSSGVRGGGSAGLFASFFVERPVLRFICLFAVLVVLYYLITSMYWFAGVVFPLNLQINATVAGFVLRAFGEQAVADGVFLNGPGVYLVIRRGCDALEPAALLVAAIIAFPVPRRQKLIGALIGVPFLLVLNIVRIISLYYIQRHAPDWFAIVHDDVWQPLFVLFAMGIWLVWLLRSTSGVQSDTKS